jgi:hypothetical protein
VLAPLIFYVVFYVGFHCVLLRGFWAMFFGLFLIVLAPLIFYVVF